MDYDLDMRDSVSTAPEANIETSMSHSYKRIKDIWSLCHDMYYEVGGFSDNSYLIPHSREYFYKNRKDISYLRNYYKAIVRATFVPVFSKGVDRETDDKFYNEFIKDCTSGGVDLTDFMRNLAAKVQNQGYVAVVMDNYPIDQQPKVDSEALEQRIFPYIYTRSPSSISDEHSIVDKNGKLIEICFIEGKVKDKILYKSWNDNDWYTWVVDGVNPDGSIRKGEQERFTHGLGEIPVKMVYSGEKINDTDIYVIPPYAGIAKINFSLYNLDSENRDISRSSRFPFLAGPPSDANARTVGTKIYFNVQEGQTMPQWITPDVSVNKDGREEAKMMIESIYQLASQKGVTGVVDQSGVAKQWDFFAHESILLETASRCKSVEEWIVYMFGLWTDSEIDCKMHYPQDFQPNNIMYIIDQIERVQLLPGVSQDAIDYLAKKAFALVTADETGIESDSILDSWVANQDDLDNSNNEFIDER